MLFWKSGNIKKEKFFVSHTKVAARLFGQCYQIDTFCLPVCWLGVATQLDVPATGQLGAGFLGISVSKVKGEMTTKFRLLLLMQPSLLKIHQNSSPLFKYIQTIFKITQFSIN